MKTQALQFNITVELEVDESSQPLTKTADQIKAKIIHYVSQRSGMRLVDAHVACSRNFVGKEIPLVWFDIMKGENEKETEHPVDT